MKINKSYLTIAILFILIDVMKPQNVPHASNIDIPEDGWLNFTGLARKYVCGRDCESHDVTTEDGYILKLFHAPGDKKRPVLLMHGVLDTADSFVLRGNHSLTAVLSAQGYDVWIGNSRGSRYSRRHITLNPDTDKVFWKFSFHELGFYDLPAMIDFILNKTGESQLSAIGHSQGNQIFYVLGASRPEYNEKIKVLVALAPICFLHNVVPPVNKVVELGPLINDFLTMFGQEEILGDLSISRPLIDLICLQDSGYQICAEGIFFTIAGPDRSEFEPEFFRIAIAHYPTGTSRTNAVHLLQVAQKKEFVNYDHGTIRNLDVYKSKVPPKYDLNKVTMKVALIAGRNDRLSSLKDVKILSKRLPNVVEYMLLDHPQFNHMDFLWGKHSNKILYPHVLKVLKTYN